MSIGRPVRSEGIEIVPTGDGVVVYDPDRDRVHYLNHTAALILELSTGDHSDEDIARMLQLGYELGESPSGHVRECLHELYEEGLVADR